MLSLQYIQKQLKYIDSCTNKFNKFQYIFIIYNHLLENEKTLSQSKYEMFRNSCLRKGIELQKEYQRFTQTEMNNKQLEFFKKSSNVLVEFINKYILKYKIIKEKKEINIDDLPYKDNNLSNVINNINFICNY
jgi:hypothetical protein